MDYTRFLNKVSEETLPYFGGLTVDTASRRLRVNQQVTPGWWKFSIEGRNANPIGQQETPILDDLPRGGGHVVGDWLFISGNKIRRINFLPEEELEIFTPVTTRTWHSGESLFDCVDFETEAEQDVRFCLELKSSLSEIKAVPTSLRAAFAFKILSDLADQLSMQVSPLELKQHFFTVCENVDNEPRRILAEIQTRRQEHDALVNARREQIRTRHVRRRNVHEMQEKLTEILAPTGADLVSFRNLNDAELEVVFRFCGERFISIVQKGTYQVIDSGVCLEGTDDLLTLESLPGVIREAMDTGQLYITRH